MEVLRDGTFVFSIDASELSKGMRPSKRNPRNSKFLYKCEGAVGLDGVLQVIDDLEDFRIDTSTEITDSFPYPQIFVFTNMIIICGETDIYEYDGATLDHKIGPVAKGQLWSAVDFYEFIYLSNGSVAVIRDATSGDYSTSPSLPVVMAMCNFNGQVVVGGIVE